MGAIIHYIPESTTEKNLRFSHPKEFNKLLINKTLALGFVTVRHLCNYIYFYYKLELSYVTTIILLIQNVLNYIWEKGKKLEIHVNIWDRSMLIRLPNDYIREKVLQKRIWYVGTSMFHVSQWITNTPAEAPSMDCLSLWEHIKGVPFDLIHQQGLYFLAGLIGKPKEMDEWTLNLASVSISHVKVEANLTKLFIRRG